MLVIVTSCAPHRKPIPRERFAKYFEISSIWWKNLGVCKERKINKMKKWNERRARQWNETCLILNIGIVQMKERKEYYTLIRTFWAFLHCLISIFTGLPCVSIGLRLLSSKMYSKRKGSIESFSLSFFMLFGQCGANYKKFHFAPYMNACGCLYYKLWWRSRII